VLRTSLEEKKVPLVSLWKGVNANVMLVIVAWEGNMRDIYMILHFGWSRMQW
jgi:hypothetical protein